MLHRSLGEESNSFEDLDIEITKEETLQNKEKALSPHSFIRENIRKAVDEVLWLDDLKFAYAHLKKRIRDYDIDGIGTRCIICTLPFGTCEHTEHGAADYAHFGSTKTEKADGEVEDILAIVAENVGRIDTSTLPEVDINSLQWESIDISTVDRIGDTPLALCAPSERGWHSCINLAGKYLVLFGGLRIRGKASPKSFDSIHNANDVECLGDTIIFDIIKQSWHGIGVSPMTLSDSSLSERPLEHNSVKPLPPGRYGHVAAALDDSHMLIYGGRGEGGSVLADTWIFNLAEQTWTNVDSLGSGMGRESPICKYLSPGAPPAPRYFSAACSVPAQVPQLSPYLSHLLPHMVGCRAGDGAKTGIRFDIYMFGGTDGTDNFNDLWVFRGSLGTRYWEQLNPSGEPPAARYGHRIMADNRSKSGHNQNSNATPDLIVLGGCSVSPRQELAGPDAANLPHWAVNLEGLGGFETTPTPLLYNRSHLFQGNSDKTEWDCENTGQSLLAHSMSSSKLSGSRFRTEDSMVSLIAATKRLEQRYSAEGSAASLIASSLQLEAAAAAEGIVGRDTRPLLKRAANASAALYLREKDTRNAEIDLLQQWKQYRADSVLAAKRSRHPLATIDVYFFDIKNSIWKKKCDPQPSGAIPGSRKDFGAFILDGKLFLGGGTFPTALEHRLVDPKHLSVYVLDLGTMEWFTPTPLHSTLSWAERMRVAEADILRAEKRCNNEKMRGMSLGALNGLTAELLAAYAVLEVTRWRHAKLLQEKDAAYPPPASRWGFSWTPVQQRAYLLCGWETHTAAASRPVPSPLLSSSLSSPYGIGVRKTDERFRQAEGGGVVVLNAEAEHARLRRLDDEFAAQLEATHIAEMARASLNNVVSVGTLRLEAMERRMGEEREQRLMAIEDIRSSFPPLSKPPKVRFVKANETTIWLDWEQVTPGIFHERVDGVGAHQFPPEIINPSNQDSTTQQVTYLLYAKGGFQHLLVGDRVIIDTTDLKIQTRTQSNDISIMGDDNTVVREDEITVRPASSSLLTRQAVLDTKGKSKKKKIDVKLYTAEIAHAHKDGHFDVVFDDGTSARRVTRAQLYLDPLHLGEARSLRYELDKSVLQAVYRFSDTGLALSVRRRNQKKDDRRAALRMRLRSLNPSLSVTPVPSRVGTAGGRVSSRPASKATANREASGHSDADASATDAVVAGIPRGSVRSLSDARNGVERRNSESAGSNFATEPISRDVTHTQCSQSYLDLQRLNDEESRLLGLSTDYNDEEGDDEVTGDDAPDVTVKPAEGWSLVYAGTDACYACSGLIPEDVVEQEPNLTVSVLFCLQTVGGEFPSYEYSLLSPVVEYATRRSGRGAVCDAMPHDLLDVHLSLDLDMPSVLSGMSFAPSVIAIPSHPSPSHLTADTQRPQADLLNPLGFQATPGTHAYRTGGYRGPRPSTSGDSVVSESDASDFGNRVAPLISSRSIARAMPTMEPSSSIRRDPRLLARPWSQPVGVAESSVFSGSRVTTDGKPHNSSVRMSKIKKDVISAVISGQQIARLERYGATVSGSGASDHFI